VNGRHRLKYCQMIERRDVHRLTQKNCGMKFRWDPAVIGGAASIALGRR
jgi:hypothetical protein